MGVDRPAPGPVQESNGRAEFLRNEVVEGAADLGHLIDHGLKYAGNPKPAREDNHPVVVWRLVHLRLPGGGWCRGAPDPPRSVYSWWGEGGTLPRTYGGGLTPLRGYSTIVLDPVGELEECPGRSGRHGKTSPIGKEIPHVPKSDSRWQSRPRSRDALHAQRPGCDQPLGGHQPHLHRFEREPSEGDGLVSSVGLGQAGRDLPPIPAQRAPGLGGGPPRPRRPRQPADLESTGWDAGSLV